MQGMSVEEHNYHDTLGLIKQASRPVSLVFSLPGLGNLKVSNGHSLTYASETRQPASNTTLSDGNKSDAIASTTDTKEQHLTVQKAAVIHANSLNDDLNVSKSDALLHAAAGPDTVQSQQPIETQHAPPHEHDLDNLRVEKCDAATKNSDLTDVQQHASDSKSARALEMLKQALPRLHQLQDAHKYQLSMALEAATDAAEKQVAQASELATAAAEEAADRSLQQARQGHAKHVQSCITQAQHDCAMQHCAAARIQSRFRTARQRWDTRTFLKAHRQRLESVSVAFDTAMELSAAEFKEKQGAYEEMIKKASAEKQKVVTAQRAQLEVALVLAGQAAEARERRAVAELCQTHAAEMKRVAASARVLDHPQVCSVQLISTTSKY